MANIIYAGGQTFRINKYDLTDLSSITASTNIAGNIESFAISGEFSGDYIYAAGWTSLYGSVIRKYELGDLTYVTQSPNYGGTIKQIAVSDNYIYAVGVTTQKIRKYNLSDLTYTGVESPAYGGDVFSMVIDGDYIYIQGDTINKIRKYNLSDLTYTGVESPTTGLIYSLKVDGNYIYAGGAGWHRKYNLSNLTLVATATSYGAVIFDTAISGNYIYAAGDAAVQKIRKYNLSDLTYTGVESPAYGSAILTIKIDGDYIYAGGYTTQKIRKYNLSDLTYTGVESASYGTTIMSLETVNESTVQAAPTNIYFVSGGTTLTTTQISWTNNNNGTGYNLIQYKDLTYGTYGGNWHDAGTVAANVNTYTITGLIPFAEYEIRVVLVGSFYPSESIFITMAAAPLGFCEVGEYTISGTTCGNADGSVNIVNPDYEILYDFVLKDVTGGTVTMTGLTAGFYFLTATPKPFVQVLYGTESCEFDWLAIHDTDTTMSNTGVSIRNIICGGFGKSQGRIAYLCADSGSNPIYTAKLYNELTRELVLTVTGSTIDRVIFVPLNSGNYYCHITNDAGCSLLLGSDEVKGESLRSVAGIRKLWLTRWVNTVEYDYWKQSDEDYYLSGLDANFFNSIKIKRFIDSTLPDIWYSVNVNTKAISFGQVMDKTKQGFVFTDKLTLTIPEADNAKWKELQDLLQDRYILVFQDNNGDYWCTGYKYGAKIDAYKMENNEYVLEFQAISDNKLLTNIDKTYIQNSIL